jgi:hypothetical protein
MDRQSVERLVQVTAGPVTLEGEAEPARRRAGRGAVRPWQRQQPPEPRNRYVARFLSHWALLSARSPCCSRTSRRSE